MLSHRHAVAFALGVMLAAAATLAACFVDPNPPDPHNHPDPNALSAMRDGGATDGGEEAGR